ncbi:MAG: class I SAM-dependent methyltransferase [Nitrospirales bacterium]|nr:class I SAM-dependent methyltransferase [Nitrospirales bacterium]
MTEIDLRSQVIDHWKAKQILSRWEQGAFALALLRASLNAGILEATREPCSPSKIASSTNLEPDMVSDFCEALLQLGILEYADGRFQLSPPFLVFTDPDAPQTLGHWFGSYDVDIKTLETCYTDQRPYQSLPPEEIVSYAKGAWGLPSSPLALISFAELDSSIPEIQEVWQHGGLHMELGCGVGRDLLRIAVSYPKVIVVGIDINRRVLDEVTAQARALGIPKRVQVRCCDARQIDDVGLYDTIMWSQLFFPPETRQQTAQVALRALKPGGFLLLPVITASPIDRLIYRHWGIRIFDSEEIKEELKQVGFEFVNLIAHPRIDYMVFHSPH